MVRQVLIRDLGSTESWADISSTIVEDYPSLRDGFGSLGAEALDVGKLSIRIKVPTLSQAALYQTTQKQVRMLIDGLVEFEGYTADASAILIEERTDYVFVTLSVYPYSKAFSSATIAEDLILKDIKICDPTDSANSLVHLLFAQLYANLPEPFATILSGASPVAVATSKTKTLPLVLIDKGKNILNMINDLLYQNGLAYYMTKYTAIIVEPYQNGRTPSVVLPITSVVTKPTITQKPYDVDKQCKLRFPTIETVENEQIFKLNEEEVIIDMDHNSYYPGEGVLITEYTTEKAESDDDVELALTEDHVLSFDSNLLTDYNSTLYAKQSFIRLLNATGSTQQLKNIWIHATAWYRKYKAFYLDSSLPEHLSEKTVDGDYIPDKTEAENFLAVFKAELLAEKTGLILKTDQNLAPNTLIQIEELPYYVLVRSRTRLLDGLGLFQYECVAYSFSPVIASTGNPVKTPPAIVEPSRSLSMYPDSYVIAVSSRNELKTQQIEITLVLTNLPVADAVWTCDDGTLEQIEIAEGVYDPYRRLLDCSTVVGDKAVVTVTVEYNGVTYPYSIGLPKIKEGLPKPLYLDAQDTVPTLTTEGPLVVGDFFLYVGPYSGPNIDPGDQGLNPPALEVNEFVYGRIYEYLDKNAEDGDQWQESRKSEHLAAAQKDALQIAKDSNTYMFVAVLVAQLGLFFDLIVAGVLKSPNYAENASGVPTAGFKLDGLRGLIKALGLEAYEAMIYGNLEASGFRTLQEEAGTIIATESITPTLWKHSEMEALIASQDSLATLSGTIDGYSFTKAVRRTNQRILLASHGYESKTIYGGSVHYFTKLYADTPLTRDAFFCEYKGYYKGNFSFRTYIGNVDDSDRQFSESLSTSYTVAKSYVFLIPRRPMVSPPSFQIAHTSNALPFFSQPSHVDYHRIWTNNRYTGLVLVNGDTSYKVIPPEPINYYPNTKTWTIGSTTQNDKSTYCSGTAFYNLFSGLQIGADGFCDGGQINVNGTLYSVTRLTKGANSITFYTSGGVITVNKANPNIATEGTIYGVYTELAVTEAINFQAVVGGIETKHIFPWGTQAGSPGVYDIGTKNERFNTAWLNYLDVQDKVAIGEYILAKKAVDLYRNFHANNTDGTWSPGYTLQSLPGGDIFAMYAGSDHMAFQRRDNAGENALAMLRLNQDGSAILAGGLNVEGADFVKISKETLNFGRVNTSQVTRTIGAMILNEVRFVNTTGSVQSSSQNTYRATLKLPSGGTYIVIGAVRNPQLRTTVYQGGHLLSGGADIWTQQNLSSDTVYLNMAIIVKRITT